jgi:alpha-L-arabinofuranosidase
LDETYNLKKSQNDQEISTAVAYINKNNEIIVDLIKKSKEQMAEIKVLNENHHAEIKTLNT